MNESLAHLIGALLCLGPPAASDGGISENSRATKGYQLNIKCVFPPRRRRLVVAAAAAAAAAREEHPLALGTRVEDGNYSF